jgi:hypothetical protein
VFRKWKIVALLIVLGITCALVNLFLAGRLMDVMERLVEVVGKLGRR